MGGQRSMTRRSLRPKRYLLAILAVAFGGFLNGFDTGSIGAITVMPFFRRDIAVLSSLLRGLTVSLLLLAGTVPSLYAGLLADRYGHVRVVFAGAVAFTIGAILEAAAIDLGMLLVGRVLVGVGEGLYLGNMNVYICEIAPKGRRGTLVALPQFLATAGICAGYFVCYGTIHISSAMQWRLPFIFQVVGGVFLAVAGCLVPQSPRWLILRGQWQKAKHNLMKLELSGTELDQGEEEIIVGADEDGEPEQSKPQMRIWQSIRQLFQKQNRFRTTLALFILGAVQLCGIDGVLYYAPTLFAQAGLSAHTASFVASGATGIAMFVVSVPAFLLTDSFNRRTIVTAGGVSLGICMLVIGSLYAAGTVEYGHGGGRWVVIVLIFLYAMSYVATWGIVGKIYASEIQVARHRATANALAQALNFFTNFIVAFITPVFLAQSASGPYFLFAGLTFVTLLVLWRWMPETRGRSLESIQDLFASSTHSHE